MAFWKWAIARERDRRSLWRRPGPPGSLGAVVEPADVCDAAVLDREHLPLFGPAALQFGHGDPETTRLTSRQVGPSTTSVTLARAPRRLLPGTDLLTAVAAAPGVARRSPVHVLGAQVQVRFEARLSAATADRTVSASSPVWAFTAAGYPGSTGAPGELPAAAR